MEPFVKFRDLALHLTVNEELNALVVTDLNLAVGELLRMCNGDPEVVRSLIEFQTLETVIEICRCIAASKDSQQKYTSLDVEQDTAILKSFVVRSCRLTSNFTACGENARTYFFGMKIERASEKSFDHLSHLLSAALVVDGRNAVAAVVSAIYNCLQASTDADRETQQAACLRNEALCEARGLLCQLLLAVISTSKLSLPGGEGSPAPDQCAAADSPTADPALEWFHMLTFQWARTGLLSRIYSTVGSSRALQEDSKGGKSVVLTHEQLILLQLGIGVMEDAYCTDILWNSGSAPGPLKSSSEPLFEQGLQQLLTSLAADLHRIDMNRIFAIEEKNAVAEAENDAVERHLQQIDERMQRSLVQDFVPLMLQLLASVLAVAPPEGGRALREALVAQTPLLEALVQLLCVSFAHKSAGRAGARKEKIGTPVEKEENASANSNTEASSAEGGLGMVSTLAAAEAEVGGGAPVEAAVDAERLREAARIALQLLGNLVYGCDVAKDALRTSGALAAVLSHCGTDFENPISREWALLCVRNACEAHEGNQRFIQELRPQEAVIQDEKLRAQGLKVEMNTETGKFKFVKT